MSDRVILNLHAVIPVSRVNGPGQRMVVFFQGCAGGCQGCFNPETHPFEPRQLLTVADLFSRHLRGTVEGITISGGEPFMQPEGLLELLKTAKEKHSLSTVVYSGFSYEEIALSRDRLRCLEFTDVLVDGGYDEALSEATLLARGSQNQRLHFFGNRYVIDDFYLPGKAEVVISGDGTIRSTGFSRISFSPDLL
jgi:anaerobic ribonucleoside-triphosphate reductase activating protein